MVSSVNGGVLLGRYLYLSQLCSGNIWRSFQLWGWSSKRSQGVHKWLAGFSGPGRKRAPIRLPLLFVNLFLQHHLTLGAPSSKESLYTPNLPLFTRYLGTDGIIASQANFLTSLKHFIIQSSVLKDLNATEDCKTKEELHLLLEFCLKTFLCTSRFLSSHRVPAASTGAARPFHHLLRPQLVLTSNSSRRITVSSSSSESFPRWNPGGTSWIGTISRKRETKIWIAKNHQNQGSQLNTQRRLINVYWLIEGLIRYVLNKEIELSHN